MRPLPPFLLSLSLFCRNIETILRSKGEEVCRSSTGAIQITEETESAPQALAEMVETQGKA